MARFATALATSLLLAGSAGATVLSGPIVNPANGNTYYFLDVALWPNAEAEANSLGGHLVTINDADEQDWVFDTFVATIPASAPRDQIWIGLNDASQEGTFVWSSGEPVTYTNWASGEPSGDGDFVLMRGVSGGGGVAPPGSWNDTISFSGGGIGEFGVVEVVPEPSAGVLALAGLLGIGCMGRRRAAGR